MKRQQLEEKDIISAEDLKKVWPGLEDWELAEGINAILCGLYDEEENYIATDFPHPYRAVRTWGAVPGKKGKQRIVKYEPYLDEEESGKFSLPYSTSHKRGIVIYDFSKIYFSISDIEKYEKDHQNVKNTTSIRIVRDTILLNEDSLPHKILELEIEIKSKNILIASLEKKIQEQTDHIHRKRGDAGVIKNFQKNLASWKEAINVFVPAAIDMGKEGPKNKSKTAIEHICKRYGKLLPAQLMSFRAALPDGYADKVNRAAIDKNPDVTAHGV